MLKFPGIIFPHVSDNNVEDESGAEENESEDNESAGGDEDVSGDDGEWFWNQKWGTFNEINFIIDNM